MKPWISVVSLGLIAATFTGCYRKELDSAREENDKRKAEIAQLRTEIIQLKEAGAKLTADKVKLKETAQYFSRLGRDQLAAGQLAKATTSFQTLIKRFPNSPQAVSAIKSLASAQLKQGANSKSKKKKAAAAPAAAPTAAPETAPAAAVKSVKAVNQIQPKSGAYAPSGDDQLRKKLALCAMFRKNIEAALSKTPEERLAEFKEFMPDTEMTLEGLQEKDTKMIEDEKSNNCEELRKTAGE